MAHLAVLVSMGRPLPQASPLQGRVVLLRGQQLWLRGQRIHMSQYRL